jgi:PHP family Zn ribbon phosphoesterase
MTPQLNKSKMQWYRIDLHLHTPGSADYQEPDATFIDILHRAELRGLDIIAFTDHNTVKGYDRMTQEIQQLELLVRLDRAQPEEKRRLAEYRRLLDRILVLPGFEFTATFGFHILGIFPPTMKVRQIEHVLLNLKLPPAVLEEGNSMVGASSDVLTAYREINNAGGIAIAAHVNSAHGVAMRGFDFGGQTKIAYTQDPYLHCLEVTDLERRGRGTTASFFNGTKPEYPRPMRCIQGSDAHRLLKDPRSEKNLGIGDRATEALLPEKSFHALIELFRGNDFARTRPYRSIGKDFYDHVHVAREAGPNIIQSFHDALDARSGKLYAIVADVCAFANTNGGTVYVGAAADITIPVVGVDRVGEGIETLRDEITHKITPPLEVEIDTLESSSRPVIRIRVQRGNDLPYAVDENRIYVREEAETVLAVRDEIVRLVQRTMPAGAAQPGAAPSRPPEQRPARTERPAPSRDQGQGRDRRGGQPRQGERSGDWQQDRQQGRPQDRPGGRYPDRQPRGQNRPSPRNQHAGVLHAGVLPTEVDDLQALPAEELPNDVIMAITNAVESVTQIDTPEVDAALMTAADDGMSDPTAVEAADNVSPAPEAAESGRRPRRRRGSKEVRPAAQADLPSDVAEGGAATEAQASDEAAPEAAESTPAPIVRRAPVAPIIVEAGRIAPPRTGVEIIGTETRKGEQFHVMRDLRNGNIVKNVTRQSARRLWHYAIMERENNPIESSRVQWAGVIGLWKRYKRGDVIRYDLVLKDNGNATRIFYGVTEDGMQGAWQQFITDTEPEIIVPDEG